LSALANLARYSSGATQHIAGWSLPHSIGLRAATEHYLLHVTAQI
jgi:hypothetical protein